MKILFSAWLALALTGIAVALAETSPMFAEPTPTPTTPPPGIPDLGPAGDVVEPVIRPELLRLVPTLLVSDLQRASNFYTQSLGFKIELATANYVAVGRDGVQIGLALDKSRSSGARMSCYINVNGVDALHRELSERKVPLAREISTQPSKMREFMVLDPDKNTIIFGEYVGN